MSCYDGEMSRALLITLLFVSPAIAEDLREQFFENRIRPVLVAHCYECHSVEADEASGGLLLDSRAGWQRGGDSGAAIVASKPDESRLIEAIAYTNRDLQMPPENRLPRQAVDDFRKWIRDGAFDPREAKTQRPVEAFDLAARAKEHWAWQPRQTFDDSHSIDQFIHDSLEKNSLSRAVPAKANELLRRLFFDLVGLPPTTTEIREFRSNHDANPDQAIESLVERLLNSPRFGEKWASHWFDVVDYSETKGHVSDQERPYAWKYRDYVINALNDDLPYDRFVLEHVAGDLLPPEQQRPGVNGEENVSPTATGVLFMHEMHFMAVDPVQQRWDEIDAQIDVIGKAFLGLTVECARCHDHKFDAVSQADYYALAGFFYSTEQGKQRIAPRQSPHKKPQKVAKLETEYEVFLKRKRDGRVKALTPKNKSGAYFPISEELGLQTTGDTANVLKKMRAIEKLDPSWSQWVRSAHDVDGQDAPLLVRGEHTNPSKERVPRRFLTAINSQSPRLSEGSGRLWLAEQIIDRDNPVHREGLRQSYLASSVRSRHRGNAERFRKARGSTVASRVARLSRTAVDRKWLVNQVFDS